MSDVQSAAERLRQALDAAHLLGEGPDEQYMDSPHDYELDLEHVARAWLAEHPADDGEPITPEWLRSVGFEAFDEHGSGWFKDSPGGSTRVSIGYRGQWLVNGTEMEYAAQPKTRGDLRRLCFALGVELKAPLTP